MNPNTHKPTTSLFLPSQGSTVFWEELAIIGFTESVLKQMEENGVSQAELAKRLGVTDAYVTKLMSGNNNFTIKTMVKIARALNCELSAPQLKDTFAVSEWRVCNEKVVTFDVSLVSGDHSQQKTPCPAADYEDLALAA